MGKKKVKAVELVFEHARIWCPLGDQSKNPSKKARVNAVRDCLSYQSKPRNRSWGELVDIKKANLDPTHPASGPRICYQLFETHPRRRRFVATQGLKKALGPESGLVAQARRRTLKEWKAFCAANPERIKRAQKKVNFKDCRDLWRWSTSKTLFCERKS